MMQEMNETAIGSRIYDAMKRLVSGAQFGNKTIVSIPVVYPSGAHAGVEIEINGDDCFVSDVGQGYAESDNYGASEFYKYSAKTACERFSTAYDGLNMFVLKTSVENMEAAIVAVANASVMAARDAFERATAEKSRRSNSDIFDRFIDVFGKERVSKVAELKGKHVSWDAHNVVSFNGRTSVFEYVADHPNAISSKFMMFSDLRRNDDAQIILNAVVHDINQISQKGQLIADVASNVVPFSATAKQFTKYAEAA